MFQGCQTKLACFSSKSVFITTCIQIIRLFFYPLLFLITLVLLQSNMALFVFDRDAIGQGEWWRLLTAHFIHSSASHALWDVLAFTGITFWLSQYSIQQMLMSVFLGIVAVDILLLSPFSSMDYYCGLSGILFSPLLLVCHHFFQEKRNVVGLLPMAVLCTKLVWEVCVQHTLFVDTAWQAYPAAHLAGLMGGLICVGFKLPSVNKALRRLFSP